MVFLIYIDSLYNNRAWMPWFVCPLGQESDFHLSILYLLNAKEIASGFSIFFFLVYSMGFM